MIHVSGTRDGRGRAKTLAVQGFSVERVTGIEPALPTWKASGTRSRLSVKMAVDLRISAFDLDRCDPYWTPFYRPYGPAKDALDGFICPPSGTDWHRRDGWKNSTRAKSRVPPDCWGRVAPGTLTAVAIPSPDPRTLVVELFPGAL